MGRIFFLSAAAFLAYKYIARSNKRHEAIGSGEGSMEILPAKAIALPLASNLIAAEQRSAAEPDPMR